MKSCNLAECAQWRDMLKAGLQTGGKEEACDSEGNLECLKPSWSSECGSLQGRF